MSESTTDPAPPERRLSSPFAAARHRSRPCARAYVAAFVCAETERLARRFGFPLAVIAATSDPARHATRLSKTLHGAWAPQAYDAWPMPFDEGLSLPSHLVYRQLAFDARWLGSAPLPEGLTLEAGSIVVDLPLGTSAANLSALVGTALSDLSYENVARRPAQVRYRYVTGRSVVIAPRYALVTPGDIERVVAVDDLFKFHPADFVTIAKAVALALDALRVGSVMARLDEGASEERETSNG